MAPPAKEDVLSFGVLVDIRASLKAMEKFSRQMKKSMKQIAASGQQMGKENEKTAKAGKRSTGDWTNAVEKLSEAYEYQDKRLKDLGDNLRELRKLSDKGDEAKKKQIAKQIKGLEKTYKLQLGSAKVAKTTRDKGGLGARMFAPGLKKAVAEIRGGGMKKALEEAGEKLKEPLQDFLKKDAHSLAEKSALGFAAVMKRSFHGARLGARVGSRYFGKRGEKAMIAGKAAGGFKGAMQQAGGGGMKVLGELLGGLGKLMRPLATLGPLLQASLIGLVKLFLDLDAEVKEFNKSIMDSTSNIEFLGRAGGSVEGAIMNMRDALDGVRRAATDASFNNSLGITKDTHVAILNTLNQEGVAFGRLTDDAGNTAEGMKDVTQSIVKMGVAYSRGLGIPLNEVASLQAEMMTEMGKSVDETRTSFALMATAAEKSGMAGNKFFNIIRSLSTDLGLFNLRLEDSVGVLSKIGKVMSPQNASKFMQSAVQGLKGMGRQDKLKLSLFAGTKKTKEIVDKDYARRQDALMKKLSGGDAKKEADLKKRFEERGYKGIKAEIEGLGKESGAVAQTAIKLGLQQSRMKKGEYGYAQGLGDVGVGAAMEANRSAMLNKDINGKQYGSIKDAIGALGFEQVAEALGKSAEDLEDMATFEEAVDAQRETMRKTMGAAADTAGWDDVVASMSDEMKKMLGADSDGRTMEEKMFDLSKGQGQATQSFQEKLSNFVDWFMTTLYDLFIDIWDGIMSVPGVGGAAKGKREVYKSGNSEMIRAFEKSLDKSGKNLDFGAFKDKLVGEGGGLKNRLDTLSQTEEGRQRIAKSVQGNLGGQDVLGMATASGLDSKKYDALAAKLKRSVAITNPTDGTVTQAPVTAGKGDLGDLNQTLKDIGLTEEELKNFFAKAGWAASDVAGLAGLGKDLGTSSGAGTPGQPASGSDASPAAAKPGSTGEVTATAAVKTTEQLAAAAEDNKKTQAVMTQQGVKLAPATLKEDAKGMEAAMLSALRTALFEYYMYKDTDQSTMIAAMKSGGSMDPRDAVQRVLQGAMSTGTPGGGVTELAKPLEAHAVGGMVTGISKGLAVVAAQGEGLASVGKGERIVPAGGGGGSGVNVVVNGIGGPDLARMIEGKVVEGIREYKRREKFN